jgi:hypothetical protein
MDQVSPLFAAQRRLRPRPRTVRATQTCMHGGKGTKGERLAVAATSPIEPPPRRVTPAAVSKTTTLARRSPFLAVPSFA